MFKMFTISWRSFLDQKYQFFFIFNSCCFHLIIQSAVKKHIFSMMKMKLRIESSVQKPEFKTICVH